MNAALDLLHVPARLVVDDLPPGGRTGVARHAEYHVAICSSALCACLEVEFLRQGNEPCDADAFPTSFVLDPFARAAAAPAPDDPPGAGAFARQVAGALRPEDWRALVDAFRTVKAEAIENLDCEREIATFPFDEIERDRVMIAYQEIVPFAEQITVELGSRRLLVDPQHCVRPDCTCNDATLVLLDVGGADPGSSFVTASDPVAVLGVDHRSGRWFDAESDAPPSSEARFFSRVLLDQHPDLFATLRRQQTTLRRLYRTAATAEGRPLTTVSAPVVAAPRVARNDPCPCGSGRKYKKCCLAASPPDGAR